MSATVKKGGLKNSVLNVKLEKALRESDLVNEAAKGDVR